MPRPEILPEQIKKIHDEVEKQRKIAADKKLNFTGLDEAQIKAKLQRVHSPMIVFQGWSGSSVPGGSISYQVGIHNPDPTNWVWLFAYSFVGPANMMTDMNAALQVADTRFGRLTTPAFPGHSIAPGVTSSLSWTLKVPTGIEGTNYEGNTFLYQADWHDVGTYLDRSVYVFNVAV